MQKETLFFLNVFRHLEYHHKNKIKLYVKQNRISGYIQPLSSLEKTHTIDAVQHPPGVGLLGTGSESVHLLWAEVEQQDEDQRDREAGEQEDGHHDDLLLVHTDLCTQKGCHAAEIKDVFILLILAKHEDRNVSTSVC